MWLVAVEESIGKSRKRWGLLALMGVIRTRPVRLSGYIDPNRIELEQKIIIFKQVYDYSTRNRKDRDVGGKQCKGLQ